MNLFLMTVQPIPSATSTKWR